MSATKSTDRKRQSEAVNRLTWAITAINAHLEELQRIWARAFGISGSQWMILMAISDLDAGEGVPVNAVARMLHLDGSFVTPQSKLLERAGLVGRKPCPLDRRVVRLSLSNKALKQLGRDSEQQQAVADIVFAGLEGDELNEFITRLTSVRRRLEKARLRLTLEL
ncbi:MarR family winged helix-turn-helix transcriptional regulator (plasmid) [Bradyrhizobium denitrificans]|jgi:DNA-binding MarR family transcriptional regulator